MFAQDARRTPVGRRAGKATAEGCCLWFSILKCQAAGPRPDPTTGPGGVLCLAPPATRARWMGKPLKQGLELRSTTCSANITPRNMPAQPRFGSRPAAATISS